MSCTNCCCEVSFSTSQFSEENSPCSSLNKLNMLQQGAWSCRKEYFYIQVYYLQVYYLLVTPLYHITLAISLTLKHHRTGNNPKKNNNYWSASTVVLQKSPGNLLIGAHNLSSGCLPVYFSVCNTFSLASPAPVGISKYLNTANPFRSLLWGRKSLG